MKRIGVDFDNTIIDYDAVFLTAAKERGLVATGFEGNKDVVRAAIRALPDGEQAWQRLQGHVYGVGIAGAVMFDGVEAFLRRSREEGHRVSIVSHKTEFGHFDAAQVNLRQAALDWMSDRGFFSADGFALRRDEVFFEGTRAEKIVRIAQIGCTHFIDDLPEVLDDLTFPPEVTKILFTNGAQHPPRPGAFAHWRDIADCVLS